MSKEYRIFETNRYLKEFDRLPKQYQQFINQKLHEYVYPQLKKDPYIGTNIKKLRNYRPVVWRYRIGNYRLFYRINVQENSVDIVSIDHRKDAYR